MLGREVEDDAMVALAQKRFAGCLGSEHAGLTFDAEVAVEAAMLRNKANDGLGEMDVKVVANDVPPCVGGGAAQQGVEKTCKVLLGPSVADHPGDFADRDIETGDQGLRAVAAILEFDRNVDETWIAGKRAYKKPGKVDSAPASLPFNTLVPAAA